MNALGIPDENYKKWGYILGLVDEGLDLIDAQAAELEDLRDTFMQIKNRIEVYLVEEETNQRVEYFGGMLDDDESEELDGFHLEDDEWEDGSSRNQ